MRKGGGEAESKKPPGGPSNSGGSVARQGVCPLSRSWHLACRAKAQARTPKHFYESSSAKEGEHVKAWGAQRSLKTWVPPPRSHAKFAFYAVRDQCFYSDFKQSSLPKPSSKAGPQKWFHVTPAPPFVPAM